MPDKLLKRWNDWSAGIGYPLDDGQAPGMYSASGLIGLVGELRPAPFKHTVTVGADDNDHYQYFFEEPLANQTPVVDASSSGAANDGTSVTVAHTVADKPNRILHVWVFENGTAGAITITYAGAAPTRTSAATSNSTLSGRRYVFIAPATGANNIVVTTATSCDIAVIAVSLYNASQTAHLHSLWGTTGTGTAVARTGIVSSTSEVMLAGSAVAENVTDTKDAGETLIATVINAGSDLRATGSYKAGSAGASMTHTLGGAGGAWVFLGGAVIGASPGPSYLYGIRGGIAGNHPCAMEKIDLVNSNFATLEAGSHALTNLNTAGQPVRYQGFWYLPDGDEYDPRKLTVASGNVAADTLAAATAWVDGGADHLSNMSGQMIAALKDNGFAILDIDGTPTTTTDWGPYFQAGDKNERASAIAGIHGLSFVLTAEGLFSFNKTARSGLVFEDFRSWRDVFSNRPMAAWKGGLAVVPPTGGLLFYMPGELPVNIGVETKGKGLPPLGITSVAAGRYMGVHATGDYIWAVYQPDVSSTAAEIHCGYPPTGDPRELTWQTVSTTTLNDAQHLLGCFVSVQGQPVSSTYYTPTAWFGDGTDLAYIVLDRQAGPFRARVDTHRVNISADAYMSTLEFSEPVELTRIVVHTSSDMASGDEWQISLITNGTGRDEKVGATIKGSGVLHKRNLDRHSVSSLTLHVNWVADSTAARVPPVITRIELYGNLDRGLGGGS